MLILFAFTEYRYTVTCKNNFLTVYAGPGLFPRAYEMYLWKHCEPSQDFVQSLSYRCHRLKMRVNMLTSVTEFCEENETTAEPTRPES